MKKKITFKFNFIATILIIIASVIVNLTESEVTAQTTLDKLIAMNPYIGYGLLLLVLPPSAYGAIYVVREIWNRLVVDLFKIREINLNEAYALGLLSLTLVG